ncbi:MAG: hypothetical protein HFE46_06960 [Clostridia bacterium]|nr:hypothetical protein [Clostridia bacterium]
MNEFDNYNQSCPVCSCGCGRCPHQNPCDNHSHGNGGCQCGNENHNNCECRRQTCCCRTRSCGCNICDCFRRLFCGCCRR